MFTNLAQAALESPNVTYGFRTVQRQRLSSLPRRPLGAALEFGRRGRLLPLSGLLPLLLSSRQLCDCRLLGGGPGRHGRLLLGPLQRGGELGKPPRTQSAEGHRHREAVDGAGRAFLALLPTRFLALLGKPLATCAVPKL